MGYGYGAWPLLIIPLVWLMQILQPFCQYFASYYLYPEEWYWVYHINVLGVMGVANFIQWTREHEPITVMVGNDRMMGMVMAIIFLGLYIYVRGIMVDNRKYEL